MTNDAILRGMLLDRRRLLRQLAHVLRRVGPNHPDRKQINARRRLRRLELKHAITDLEKQIAAHCDKMLFDHGDHDD